MIVEEIGISAKTDATLPTPALPTSVLLVEDDPDSAVLITAAVRRHDEHAEVTVCTTFAQMHDHNLRRFDLVLCDHNLPDGTSFDAIEVVQTEHPSVPVIVITGEHAADVAAEAIRRGASDYLPKSHEYLTLLPMIISKNLESARIRHDNHRLQAALASSLAELKRKNKELAESAAQYKELATTDSLTGLANRRVLDERLVQMFAEAVRYQNTLTCLMIDLDGFKGVNDTLGHRVGDQLLEFAGQLITREIRTADLGVRCGGDEFVLLLPHTQPTDAAAIAQRLLERFNLGSRTLIGFEAECSMSIGVSSTNARTITEPWQLMAHADFALYQAKADEEHRIMLCAESGDAATPYRADAA